MLKPKVPRVKFRWRQGKSACGFRGCAVTAGKSRKGYGLGDDLPVWSGRPSALSPSAEHAAPREKAA